MNPEIQFINFEMGGNLDGRGCVSASKMVFGFITPGMVIISIDYMARATCH